MTDGIERERELAVERLSQHFAADFLSLEELEQRIEQLYKARSVDAIQLLMKDLPSGEAAVVSRRAAPPPVADAFVQEHDRIISILSETKRRGMWHPPRRLDVWCVMSDTKLDLTDAQLAPGVTEIHARVVMASMKVTVPPGVRVVVQPGHFMASISDETTDPPRVGSGAPVVRITGVLIMGELKVRSAAK